MGTATVESAFGTDVEPEVTAEQPAPTFVDGKYATSGDLEKGYTDLATSHGAQSTEIGELRKQAEALQGQLAESQADTARQVDEARNKQPATDYENLQTELFKQLEDGDITDAEYARQSNTLTAQSVEAQSQEKLDVAMKTMEDKTNAILADRDHQDVVNEFYKANDGFEQAQADGSIEQVKATNPLLDDISAFFVLKNQGLQKQLEDLKLAQGSKDAGTVIQDPGASMKTPPKKAVGELAIKQSMMNALPG